MIPAWTAYKTDVDASFGSSSAPEPLITAKGPDDLVLVLGLQHQLHILHQGMILQRAQVLADLLGISLLDSYLALQHTEISAMHNFFQFAFHSPRPTRSDGL